VKQPDWNARFVVNQLDVEYVDGMYTLRYWSHPGDSMVRLPPVLTRSMGMVMARELRFVVKMAFHS
jgi:hypothetical protein